jgi:hypothetical protein
MSLRRYVTFTRVEAVPGDFAGIDMVPPPHRVFICYEDDDLARYTALTTMEFWRGGEDSPWCVWTTSTVTARRSVPRVSDCWTTSPDGCAWSGLPGSRRSRISPRRISSSLAEAIHERYLLEQLR